MECSCSVLKYFNKKVLSSLIAFLRHVECGLDLKIYRRDSHFVKVSSFTFYPFPPLVLC